MRPTLYGLKFRNEWLLPSFQFTDRGLVPGIEDVIERMPRDLHPLRVYRWFTEPDPDLESEGPSEPLSPREWLAAGHSPAAVAELVEGL